MSSRMVNSDRIDNLAQSDQSELDSVIEDTYSPLSDVDNNFSGIANDSLPSSGVVALEVRKKGEQQKQKWSRIRAFDSWLWNSFYLDLNAVKHGKRSYFDTLTRCESCHDLYWRDEKHCRICHTTSELHFDLEETYAIHVATCKEKEASDTFPKHKVLSSQIQSLKAAMHAIEMKGWGWRENKAKRGIYSMRYWGGIDENAYCCEWSRMVDWHPPALSD
ncbi:homeobox-DDT domain protein RLT3-like isoform X3 [Prunus yedoensis var. nudiflora]|uniref:Homeobox-DDT domain protein RLT3-like isoform X3 n=1 Tax=Prunus yedoensis var. nudiflora TaxID=2094558 RepID=A0A315ACH3_PRUYE|nr:homeobox-DDT domain protein RLT3-like isoform X3 [Prunus yedoensis var. nudiflora]